MVVGTDHVQRGHLDSTPAALGLGYALLVANILLINGFPDARADASVGKRTLVVQLGARGAAGVYTLMALAAHGLLALSVVTHLAPAGAWWGLVSAPTALGAAVLLWQRAATPSTLRPAIGLSIASAVLHGLGLGLGLWLG